MKKNALNFVLLNASFRPVGSHQPEAYCQFAFSPSLSVLCSDEVGVDVCVPSYYVQSIDSSASLAPCAFKYDRLVSYEPSGHSQGKIPRLFWLYL